MALGLWKHGEKCTLAGKIKFIDAIEKESSRGVGAGICGQAILDPLQHMVRIEDRTVQSFQWGFSLTRKPVQYPRVYFFSCPTFPENQNRDIRPSNVEERSVQSFHGFSVPDYKVGVGQKLDGARWVAHIAKPAGSGMGLDATARKCGGPIPEHKVQLADHKEG
jgi:hypothetical protein